MFRSGCGKSTLLSLIAGLYLPTKGSVILRQEGDISNRNSSNSSSDAFTSTEYLRSQVYGLFIFSFTLF